MPLGDWTTTLEAELSNATDAGLTDDEINQTRVLVRERGKVEHDWGGVSFEAGYTDTGRHTPGSARAFLQSFGGVGSPTALRRPDNSANQSGLTSTLTGAKDQGRLAVDEDSYELWCYSTAGVWTRVNVPVAATGVVATSTDTAALVNGVITTLGGWTTALSVTMPATPGRFQAIINASIPLRVTGTSDRYARVSMNRTSPSALPLVHKEAIVPQRVGGGGTVGITWFEFFYANSVYDPADVLTIEFTGEVNTGADTLWGAGAAILTADGAVNIRPRCEIWLRPVQT
jgi:hypothetical protein